MNLYIWFRLSNREDRQILGFVIEKDLESARELLSHWYYDGSDKERELLFTKEPDLIMELDVPKAHTIGYAKGPQIIVQDYVTW